MTSHHFSVKNIFSCSALTFGFAHTFDFVDTLAKYPKNGNYELGK